MRKMNMQFHATIEDLHEFILNVIENHSSQICGVIYFPCYTIENIVGYIDITDIENIKKYDYIVISKDSIPRANDNYNFMKLQDNNLFIDIGKNDNGEIKESAISVFSETEIDPDWKRIINKYKRSLLKGAWVVDPDTNKKAYYKNHMYTANAKLAYENGVKIRPIGGWNIYELTNEQDM